MALLRPRELLELSQSTRRQARPYDCSRGIEEEHLENNEKFRACDYDDDPCDPRPRLSGFNANLSLMTVHHLGDL